MIFKDGFYQVQLDQHDCDILLEGQVQLIIEVLTSGTLDLKLTCAKHSEASVLIMNRSQNDTHVIEDINLLEGSELSLNFGEFTKGNHRKKTEVNFLEKYTKCAIHGAMLVEDKLTWHVHANHMSSHSYCDVNLNGIAAKDSFVDLEIVGRIPKGNGQSETHQMTRMMALGNPKKVRVFPMLLITENDVAASHAASVGQPDENAIYYLQSRGLTYEMSKRMLMMGYLMPILNGIKDPKLKEIFENEIKDKVENHG